MFIRNFLLGLLATCAFTLFSSFAISDEVAEDDPPPPPPADETTEEVPETPKESTAVQPGVTPAPQPQTIIYALPPGVTLQQPEPDPLVNLRSKPKKLRYVEGEDPPEGYVEVEKRRRALVISGAALFGGTYLFCVLLSEANIKLAIPILGPMIAGFGYEHDQGDDSYPSYDSSDDSDREATMRLYGTFGTLAQTAGVVLFIVGLASKKKIWLRQDIAGLSIQFTPTLVGENGTGLGVAGTF